MNDLPNSLSCSFSHDNNFAVCSEEGVLRIWDSVSGEQKTEFTPPSHLSAAFTCLSWKIPRNTRENKKETQKSKADQTNIIALGTKSGEIYLYDYSLGDLAGKFDGKHTGQINDLCWSHDNSLLYSCSSDKHVIEWDISSFACKSKWEGDKQDVTCVALGPTVSTLFTASKNIKLWDLETKSIITQFTGHSSSIFKIRRVKREEGDNENIDGQYFLSTSCEDRIINAWQVRKKKTSKRPITTFTLPSEPLGFDVVHPIQSKDKSVKVLSVTTNGEVLICSHHLNGQTRKPVKPFKTVAITDNSGACIKIINAKFIDDSSNKILMAYGIGLFIKFEILNLEDYKNDESINLSRKNPSETKIIVNKPHTKLKVPIKNLTEVLTLMPGATGHSKSVGVDLNGDKTDDAKKRKRTKSIGETQMTMEDRVQAISGGGGGPSSDTPKVASSAVLLMQGLQSNDSEILNRVLQKVNEQLIDNTVQRLSVKFVIPLIKEIMRRLGGDPSRSQTLIKWLRLTLQRHTAYLMTDPNMRLVVNHLNDVIEARTSNHKKFLKLEAKLELASSQIKLWRKSKQLSTSDVPANPAYVYEEESSDEQDDALVDDLPTQHSDSSTSDWEEEQSDEEMEKLTNGDAEMQTT